MKPHHLALMQEVETVGLKPRFIVTGGNHVKIEWDVQGKTYSIITALSPGDHRSTLNARATLRRKFKELGLYKPTIESSGRVADEDPGVPPALEARVQQLEQDVVTLLEMISDAGKPKPVERVPRRSKLLLYVPLDRWLTVKEIARHSGQSLGSVAVGLSRLKKCGIVEHDVRRCTWRKIPVPIER